MRAKWVTKIGIVLTLCAFGGTAFGDLLARWDVWPDVSGAGLSNQVGAVAADITATVAWPTGLKWIRNWAGSSDETFGTLVGAVKSTSTASGALMSTGGAYLDFTLQNTGSQAYALDGFHFDAWRAYGGSPSNSTLSIIAGDIALTNNFATAVFSAKGAAPVVNTSDYDDFDIALTGLADNILGAGESVTFRLMLGTGNGSASTYIDNVAFTATAVVPEPTTLGLFVVSTAGILIVRKALVK